MYEEEPNRCPFFKVERSRNNVHGRGHEHYSEGHQVWFLCPNRAILRNPDEPAIDLKPHGGHL